MIERYFAQGRLFQWTKLQEQDSPMDGSIIDNPQMAHSPMIYRGVDARLYEQTPNSVTVHSPAGLTMGMGIPYRWLAYAPYCTTRLPLTGDVLTGPMAGCILPVWDEGRRYVGHVGTGGTMFIKKNDKVKALFAVQMPQNTSGFNPATGIWPEATTILAKLKPVQDWMIMALVTANSQCFSILMVKVKNPDIWCVGGIKTVRGMDYTDLRNKFLPAGGTTLRDVMDGL